MLEPQKEIRAHGGWMGYKIDECGNYQQLVSLLSKHIEDLDSQLTEFRCAISEIITGGYGDPVELAKSARLSDLEAEEQMRSTRQRICEFKKAIELARN